MDLQTAMRLIDIKETELQDSKVVKKKCRLALGRHHPDSEHGNTSLFMLTQDAVDVVKNHSKRGSTATVHTVNTPTKPDSSARGTVTKGRFTHGSGFNDIHQVL